MSAIEKLADELDPRKREFYKPHLATSAANICPSRGRW